MTATRPAEQSTAPALARLVLVAEDNAQGWCTQGHSLEDGLFKSAYTNIGAGCTIGVHAFVHHGVTMGDGSVLDADAFLMKGEELAPSSWWQGNPATEVPRSQVQIPALTQHTDFGQLALTAAPPILVPTLEQPALAMQPVPAHPMARQPMPPPPAPAPPQRPPALPPQPEPDPAALAARVADLERMLRQMEERERQRGDS